MLGSLVAIIAGFVAGMMFVMGYAYLVFRDDFTSFLEFLGGFQGLQETLMVMLLASPIMVTLQLLLGFIVDALGGYIAAHVAKHSEIKHALWVGIVLVVVDVLLLLPSGVQYVFLQVSDVALSLVAAVFGGWVRKTTRQEAQELF